MHPFHKDDKVIKEIYLVSSMYYRRGKDFDEAQVVMEKSQTGSVPWVALKMNGTLKAKINLAHVIAVHYEQEENKKPTAIYS